MTYFFKGKEYHLKIEVIDSKKPHIKETRSLKIEKGKKYGLVKTYMAHHQGLILLSINNLFNNQILQKRFMKNPQIEAVSILLQETMPEKFIITKENKEKVEKFKYVDYIRIIIFLVFEVKLCSGNE